MARKKYGRSRKGRRRPQTNRWRFVAGIILLGILIYAFWPKGGADSEPVAMEPTVSGDASVGSVVDPEAAVEEVIQASEYAPMLPPMTPVSDIPQPEEVVMRSGEPAVVVASRPSVATPYNDRVAQVVQDAMARLNANPNSLVEVRARLNDALLEGMAEDQRSLIKSAMARLSEQWLFSRQIYAGDPLCETYHVQPGNRLSRIGEKYQIPYAFIMKINGMNSDRELQADSKIKVVKGPFHAKVYRSTYTMDIYLQKTYVRSYKIGLGAVGCETPTGVWLVKPNDKLVRPQWTDPETGRVYLGDDEDYPLGSRWIGLQGLEGNAVGRTGFAIHGTKDPESIGTRSSRGCIRLHNGHVVEVYNMLMDGVSQVRVYE